MAKKTVKTDATDKTLEKVEVTSEVTEVEDVVAEPIAEETAEVVTEDSVSEVVEPEPVVTATEVEPSGPAFWVSFDLDSHKTNGICNAEFAVYASDEKDAVTKVLKALAPVYGTALIEPSISVMELNVGESFEANESPNKTNRVLYED